MAKLRFAKDLKDKDVVNDQFLVKYSAVVQARNGKPYLNVVLSDASGDLEARVWEGVSKTFADVKVLQDVSFDLKAGEVHILAGENGAGKSTLIKILAGLHTDFEGTVRLAHNARISVIHQELTLIDSMSVVDNIFLGHERGRGLLVDRAAQRTRALELCRLLHLDVDLDKPVEEFSMSVKNRIEIAKALSLDSNVIIMDEPTSALTKPECETFFAIVDSLKARGCGIVYISHRMDEIYRLADRITVLRDGKSVGTANSSELPEAKFVHWMIGRPLGDQYPRRPPQSSGSVVLSVRNFHVPNPIASAARAKPWLVENASFDVRAGEIIGVAGLQGSGNSDLFAGLFGAHDGVVSGRVCIDGKSIEVRSPRQMIKAGLGFLTSDRKATGLVLGLGIRENITLASLADFSRTGGWLKPAIERSAAANYARKLRIRSHSIEQEVGSLSGGNQQKVVLAKWLETRPKVLLLDEPTRGVDIGAKREIYALMNELTAQGLGIVVISTEMPELLALSDRVLVMHRGQVTAEFSREQATQEKILRAAMGESAA